MKRTKFLPLLALALLLPLLTLPVRAERALNPGEAAVLADYIAGEVGGEPYALQLAVAATLFNQLDDPRYPDTVSGILTLRGYRCKKPGTVSDSARSAVWAASEGMDITGGATAFGKAGTAETSGISVTFAFGDYVFGRE